MVEDFIYKWGPDSGRQYGEFVTDLRKLLELYGKATLLHESLPDVEHGHGDPV
jgi:hypothetical protein